MLEVKLNDYRKYSHFSASEYDDSVCDMFKYYFFNQDAFYDYLTLFENIDDYTPDKLPELEGLDELQIRKYLNIVISSIPLKILFKCFGQAFDDDFVPNSLEEICQTIRKAKIYYDCEVVKENDYIICYNAAIDYFKENLNGEKDSVDEDCFYEVYADFYDRLENYLISSNEY